MNVRQVPVPAGLTAWPHPSTWDGVLWGQWLRGRGWSEDAIGQYLRRRDALSFKVQTGKGKTAETHVVYAPTPKGVEFHLCPAPNLLYGGAAGGAKSYTARWDAWLRLATVPGAKLLMLRRKFTELVDNHINDVTREVERLKSLKLPVEYYKDERRVVWSHPGGMDAWLRFGHCQNEGDEDQYLSSDYEAVYPDETATFAKKQVMAVASRLRSRLPGVMPVLRCTSNPGGAQTLWLKRWFIDRDAEGIRAEDDPEYDPREWAFLDAKLWDNPYLMDPDGTWRRYEKRLTPLGRERAAQMLEGNWDVIAGQFFSEFRRDVHVQAKAVPPGTQCFRCMDWGYNAPGVCYWVACLPDGHLHVFHEYKFRQTIAADVAQEIKARNKALGNPEVRYTVADPSMWNHSGQTGESIAETMARAGVPLKKGTNEREVGWQRLRHWLARDAEGQPWLTIDPGCAYLAATLPALISDETRAEDVDTTGDDHGADALRYGVMSRPAPTQVLSGPTTPPPGSVGHLVRQAIEEASRSRRRFGRAA